MREERLATHTAPRISLVRDRAEPVTEGRRLALLQKGFRPFFLGAAAFALVAVPLWAALFSGLSSGVAWFAPMHWHAHEMLFGFTLAVIAGFLLTAASNWTASETLVGWPLAALFGAWLLARVLFFFPTPTQSLALLTSVVDVAFAPVVAIAIGRPILRARSYRNLGFVVILGAFAASNLLTHLGAWGVMSSGVVLGLELALNLTLLVIVIVSGRVIPMFTRNATGLSWVRSSPGWERASILAMLAVAVIDVLPLPPWTMGAAAAVAGSCIALRARFWGFRAALRHPLLWILHLGCAWIALGLFLESASAFGIAYAATWKHALTVGGIGSLTLGMMVRVTLGHTGRMLAAPRGAVVSFVAIAVGALVRVAGPIVFPSYVIAVIWASVVLWVLAFASFLSACGPMLVSRRVDGRPG